MSKTTETVPCRFCGGQTASTGTKQCDGCWEVTRRIEKFIKSKEGVAHILKVLSGAYPSLTLRKVEEKELKDEKHYLALVDGRYDTAYFNSELRTLTCQRYRIPSRDTTAIYELPQ